METRTICAYLDGRDPVGAARVNRTAQVWGGGLCGQPRVVWSALKRHGTRHQGRHGTGLDADRAKREGTFLT